MTYNYKDISYEKRPLTDDIALWVITNELPDTEEKLDAFEKLAKPYKVGEEASQQDACPVVGIKGLREYVDFLKKTYEGFRIRHAQLSGIAAIKETVSCIDSDTAAYLIAAGSMAVAAAKYENGSDEVLLANGILPLVSDEDIANDTFILIRKIRNDIFSGKLEAYAVTPESLTPLDIGIGAYSAEQLDKILK